MGNPISDTELERMLTDGWTPEQVRRLARDHIELRQRSSADPLPSLPEGWSSLELCRHTLHGNLAVTAYEDGLITADLWSEGSATPIGHGFATVEEAVSACERELAALQREAPAECGPESVDADGREVSDG
jgi:hypothetical protein